MMPKSSGTVIFQLTDVVLPAATENVPCFVFVFNISVIFFFCYRIKKNSRLAFPVNNSSERLVILAVNCRVSPMRRKRGTFGITINFFVAVNSCSIIPVIRSLVFANAMNFHLVKDSGRVNLMITSPLSFVCNSG